MRLIDADELERYIKLHGIAGVGYSDNERVADVVDMIDSQPDIDVVKHGHWKRRCLRTEPFPLYDYRCSECQSYNDYDTDFCPNCGSKMRGAAG